MPYEFPIDHKEKRVAICDLGGVIVPLKEMDEWWSKLYLRSTLWTTIKEFETAKTIAIEVACKPFERGEINEDVFQILFRRIIGLTSMSPEEFWRHYVDITNGVNDPLVECLRTMRERGVVLALLSNLDKERHNHITRTHPDTYEWITASFHYAFFSYQIGSCKPEPDIYRHVVKEVAALPHRIYYLDDYAPNIDGMTAATPIPRENMHIYTIDKHEEAAAFLRSHDLIP